MPHRFEHGDALPPPRRMWAGSRMTFARPLRIGDAASRVSTIADAPASAWQREIHPDPVLLFRYSALTYNSHRIHYDQPYVCGAPAAGGGEAPLWMADRDGALCMDATARFA